MPKYLATFTAANSHPDNRGLRALYVMSPSMPGSNLRLVDQSRNRRDAAISAAPVRDVAPGGQLGLKFNGSTQSGTAPNSSGDSGLTVAFWWKTTSTTSNYVAIGWFDRMWVGLENGKLAFFPNYTGSVREPVATANDGKWHRCVATHLGGVSKVFVDGVERASGAGTLHTTPIATMGVAQFGSSTTYRFPGSLAGIRVHGVGFQPDWAARDYRYSQQLENDPRLVTFFRGGYSEVVGGSAIPVFMNHYRQQGICG